MPANVFTIPANAHFAETLARGIVSRLKADSDPFSLARATILLPTRRAVRTLTDEFSRVLGAALLPDIRPLGDMDDEEFLLGPGSEDLSFPPEISPIRQRLLLTSMVQRWDRHRHGGRLTFAQAASLAKSLADLLGEIETQGADLSRLDALAPTELAEHWADVKMFLSLLRDQWPELLKAEGAIDPAVRRNLSLAALVTRFKDFPPDTPVIAAGSTGSIPATGELLKTIAHLPEGSVVLPGLDRDLDETSWESLDPGHPQYGMKELLQRIGVARGSVADWDGHDGGSRNTLLREALRPAPTTDAWRTIAERGTSDIAEGLKDLSVVEAAHPGEEAAAIALMLREVLEASDRSAALVTPDRNLARRVASELSRWNITIDDTAGQPLVRSPPGAFLCHVAEAAASAFAPVSLLALLNHPLAAGGEAQAEFRAQVRALDLCLRGPRPDPGLDGIARMIARRKANTRDKAASANATALEPWFKRLQECLTPLANAMTAKEITISDAITLHVAAAEALAATDAEPGAARLWNGDAGASASTLLNELSKASQPTDRTGALPSMEPSSYPVLFRALAEERAVRPAHGRHPRLAIFGPLESRLRNFDLVVLGGLNEGTWPRAAAADAWLSRPMRKALGLEQPERRTGLAAHDFATLTAGRRVVLTRSLKVEGSPAVASRWLQRLLQITKGLGLDLSGSASTPYTTLARMLCEPDTRPAPASRPAPRPPIARRPRNLSVTEIETWLRDPYAIYAKHVLKLVPLEPLDADIGPLERGTAVHTALERFLKRFPGPLPPDAEAQLVSIAGAVFAELGLPAAARALWSPRFARAAQWFVREERARRLNIAKSHVEIRGQRDFSGPAGTFTLRARADRIDVLPDGCGAVVDYKTGNPPNNKQVTALLAPQLPLEGAILAEGGFGEIGTLAPTELIYIRFGGGAEPGETRFIPGDIPSLVKDAEAKLLARIAEFDSEATPYHPRVMPFRADQAGDYDHLARVREWSLTGWEEDEE